MEIFIDFASFEKYSSFEMTYVQCLTLPERFQNAVSRSEVAQQMIAHCKTNP